MDLDDIRILLQVVEVGSVQGAAQLSGLSRSTLRRRLGQLEASVGSELLRAGPAGVALTAAGAVVVTEGRLLLERSARMMSAARASRDEAVGSLRFIIPVGMPDRVRVTLFRALRLVAPAMRVVQFEYADPLQHLHEPFELMIHFGDPPPSGQWFSRLMARRRLVPIASQAYLDAAGRPTTVDELSAHTLLGWRRPDLDPTRWPLWQGGSVAVEPALIADSGQMIHTAVQHGLGIGLGADDGLFLLESTPVVPVLDDDIGHEFTVRSLSPVPTHADPRMRAVLSGLQEFLDRLPPA